MLQPGAQVPALKVPVPELPVWMPQEPPVFLLQLFSLPASWLPVF